MEDVKLWLNPALDLIAVGACALVLLRLGRLEKAAATWAEREARLRELLEALRGSTAQAEGLAIELDRRLERQASRLETAGRPTAEAPVQANRSTRAALAAAMSRAMGTGSLSAPAEGERTVDRRAEIARLVAAGHSAEAIARRLDLPLAEVRLGVRLAAEPASTGRLAPPAPSGTRPAESTRQILPASLSRVA